MSGAGGAYDNFHLGVGGAHLAHHLGEGVHDGLVGAAVVDVVGAEHELHNVGLGLLQPASQVLVGDVDGLPARVALVVEIEAGGGGLAVLRVAGHGAHELHLVREAGAGQLVPHQGPPASDLRDRVSHEHWMSTRVSTPCSAKSPSVVRVLLILTLSVCAWPTAHRPAAASSSPAAFMVEEAASTNRRARSSRKTVADGGWGESERRNRRRRCLPTYPPTYLYLYTQTHGRGKSVSHRHVASCCSEYRRLLLFILGVLSIQVGWQSKVK